MAELDLRFQKNKEGHPFATVMNSVKLHSQGAMGPFGPHEAPPLLAPRQPLFAAAYERLGPRIGSLPDGDGRRDGVTHASLAPR